MTRAFRAFALTLCVLALAATTNACSKAEAAAPSGDYTQHDIQHYFAKAVNIDGATTIAGQVDLTSTKNSGSCTLDGASPSVCTATVFSGAKCTCSPVGATAAIAAAGCAVGLSGTTLTVTSANSATNVVNYACL
jgi:hypothetical protein